MQHLKVGNGFLSCKLGQGLLIFCLSWLFLTTAVWFVVEQLIQLPKLFAHIPYVSPATLVLWQPSCTIRLLNLQLAQCAPFDSSNPTPCTCLCFIAFQFWFADIWHCCVWHNEVAGSREQAGLPGLAVGNKNWHSSWKPKSMLNWNASEQHFEVRIN